MISEIEDYFTRGCGRCARFATPDCSTRKWQRGLHELRRICLAAGLVETVKWGHPCYTHAGRNIVVIGAFRGDIRLTFMNAALMQDPMGLLERSGPNARHPDLIRFNGDDQVGGKAAAIEAYLKEAMDYAEAGIKPVKNEQEIVLPDELAEALAGDRELADAFQKLTPGRRRSYVLNLAGAKTAATRVSRIAKLRPKILAGKGANER